MNTIEQLSGAFARLSESDRQRLTREMNGEAERESIQRGKVYAIIRELRVSNHSLRSSDYQAALRDVQQVVSKIEGEGA